MSVGIHSGDVDFGRGMLDLTHYPLRDLVGIRGHYLELYRLSSALYDRVADSGGSEAAQAIRD